MRITIIGEQCEDIFIYGTVKRLSPEAPVPVFNPLHTEFNKGMAGNVIENIKSLNNEVEIRFIHQDETITKTRYVEEKSNHMFIRVDEENLVSPLVLTDEHIDWIKESDGVIVSDYHKGFLTENVLCEIAYYSKFSIIDSKRDLTKKVYDSYNFIKLNENEYQNFTKNVIVDNCDKLLITLGKKGAQYKDKLYKSPKPKETIDVSGAGDTFTASFTTKYLNTKNVEESIIYANEMASIVVSKRGVTPP